MINELLQSIVYKTEIYDMNRLNALLKNDFIDNNQKKRLKEMKKNKGKMAYKVSEQYRIHNRKEDKMTELLPLRMISYLNDPHEKEHCSGLQNLSSDVRAALTESHYWDIDIVNSGPTIVWNLIRKYDTNEILKTEILERIVMDRESVFNEIMDDLPEWDKDTIKKNIISILNGGSCREHDLLIQFEKEMKDIIKFMTGQFVDLALKLTIIKDAALENNVIMANIVFIEERKILNQINNFMIENKRQMLVFINDGGLVLKLDGELEFPQELLRQAEQYVKDNIDYEIKLLSKPIKNTIEFDFKNVSPEMSYAARKIEFEKYNMYIKCRTEYLYYDGIATIHRSRALLMIDAENFKFEELKNGEVVEQNFVKEWMKDSNKLTYYDVKFAPYPTECPFGYYNLWYGHRILKISNNEFNIDNESDVDFVLGYWKQMCNNDNELYEFVLDWISFLLKLPGKRNNIALVFKSIEGAGKNLAIYDVLECLLGNYCICPDKPQQVMGHFNASVENKLLVCLDESKESNAIAFRAELKKFVTTTKHDIEKKGKDVVNNVNTYIHTLVFSNDEDPVVIDKNNRRFVLIDCEIKTIMPMQTKDRFLSITNNNQSLRCLYERLVKRDSEKRDWTILPKSSAVENIIEHTLPKEILWFREKCREWILNKVENPHPKVLCKELFLEFAHWEKIHFPAHRHMDVNVFGKKICAFVGKLSQSEIVLDMDAGCRCLIPNIALLDKIKWVG